MFFTALSLDRGNKNARGQWPSLHSHNVTPVLDFCHDKHVFHNETLYIDKTLKPIRVETFTQIIQLKQSASEMLLG